MKLPLLILAAFLPTFLADTNEFSGACPTVQPVSSFDLNRFATGKWYLVEEADNEGDRCVAVEFTQTPEKLRKKTGVEKDGDVINKSKVYTMDTSGVFTFTEKDGDKNDYTVLATDYDNFAVLFKCDFDSGDNEHEEDVYIYVREGKVSDPSSTVTSAKNAIQGKGIQTSVYYTVSHANCDSTASRRR